MKTRTIGVLASVVSSFFLTASVAPRQNVRLNQDSFRFAGELIDQGHFIADKKNAWGEHQPSADEENEFIRTYGFGEYAKWHLGIDDRHGEKTKAHCKFPFGDFKNVHRSALLAIRSRARQFGYSEIEKAAHELQRRLEGKTPTVRPPHVASSPTAMRTHSAAGSIQLLCLIGAPHQFVCW